MGSRGTQHKKQVYKTVHKPQINKPAPVKKKIAVVVGKAYSIDEIQTLLADLSGENIDREIAAVAQFAENQGAISEVAASAPEVSGTEIMELVIAAVLKNESALLTKFESQRKVNALSFIAKSTVIPPATAKKAEAALVRINPTKTELKETKKQEPTLVKTPYTPMQVTVLIQNLESKLKEVKIPAAIQFIVDYPKIAPTVAQIPLLTVTHVTNKAVEIIKENTDAVISDMVAKKMRPALIFLSSLSQVPLAIQKKAHDAAEKLRISLPSPEQTTIVKPLARGPGGDVESLRSKDYSPFELRALCDGLGSTERVRVVASAIEFLKNYDIIAKAISQSPAYTITDVSKLAVKAIDDNLDTILKELYKKREINAVRFLAESSKFSSNTQKTATKFLKLMSNPFADRKK
ncbi:hypothetical protein KKE92_02635 [Candidatus Micrarchaeota archaeon]|nr:hypothetical protein [Candidatus Micrarchaeota archaeon]